MGACTTGRKGRLRDVPVGIGSSRFAVCVWGRHFALCGMQRGFVDAIQSRSQCLQGRHPRDSRGWYLYAFGSLAWQSMLVLSKGYENCPVVC